MLFEEFFEPCVRFVEFKESDGEGGWRTSSSESEPFDAAIVMDTTNDGLIAESERMSRTYTVTALVGTNLAFWEQIKRLSDGQMFRIVSVPKDKTTPSRASFQFEQVKAEAIGVPAKSEDEPEDEPDVEEPEEPEDE